MNLADNLLNNFQINPDKICLIEKDIKIDYKALYNRVSNFALYLKKQGIKKEDNILVLIPMSINLYVTLLALWSIGASACFMDAGFIKNGMKKNEFKEVNGIIGISKYLIYSKINKKLRKLKIQINSNIINKLTGSADLKIEELKETANAILTYTSGTTGTPKIAARSHMFLQNQGLILKQCLNYEENDIELSSVPIFTLSNINVGIKTVIANGNFANLGKSNASNLVKQIQLNNINRIMAAPGLLNLIIEYSLNNSIKLNNVKKVFTGGGAIFLDFIEKIKIVFPNATITSLYGSTEAEPIAMLNIKDMTKDDIEKTKKGFGILAGNIVGVDDCKIIKTGLKEIGNLSLQEFEKIQTSEIGEIVVSGNNVLEGYVNGVGNKENKFSINGKKYHRTGDLGYIENGKLWLRGRIKEPFFNIEAALHANLKIGKTAIFKNKDKIILVLEKSDLVSSKDIYNCIKFDKIDEILYVNKIPVDKRHNTKVNYNELKKMLKLIS